MVTLAWECGGRQGVKTTCSDAASRRPAWQHESLAQGFKKKKEEEGWEISDSLQTTKKIAFGDVWNDWVHHLCQHDLKNPEGGGKTGTAENQGCRLPWVNGSVHYLPYRVGFNSVWEHRKQVTLDCRMSPLSLAGCR